MLTVLTLANPADLEDLPPGEFESYELEFPGNSDEYSKTYVEVIKGQVTGVILHETEDNPGSPISTRYELIAQLVCEQSKLNFKDVFFFRYDARPEKYYLSEFHIICFEGNFSYIFPTDLNNIISTIFKPLVVW